MSPLMMESFSPGRQDGDTEQRSRQISLAGVHRGKVVWEGLVLPCLPPHFVSGEDSQEGIP